MASLTLGKKVDGLNLFYTTADPWAASLTLRQAGVPIQWPSAPALEFPDLDGVGPFVASLSTVDSVPNAMASWSLTAGQVDELHSATGGDPTRVRLAVGESTWWKGYTIPDA